MSTLGMNQAFAPWGWLTPAPVVHRPRLRRARTASSNKPTADSRGAVVFLGIFMACFLIGCLWSLMGIGETLISRQLYQEVADNSSYSSATIHAKGMNLIAAINLMMLAIVFLYLILCVIVDLLLAAAAIACATIYGIPLGLKLANMAKKVDKVANGYKSGMKAIMPVLSMTQTVTAFLAPWVGAGAGMIVAKNYGYMSVTVSPSMIPGALTKLIPLGKLGKNAPSARAETAKASGAKIGLPVMSEHVNYLCQVAVSKLLGAIAGLFGSSQGGALGVVQGMLGSAVTSMHCREKGSNDDSEESKGSYYHKVKEKKGVLAKIWKAAVGVVLTIIGGVFTVYKSDKLWGERGPKSTYTPAKNGSEWNKVWSFSFATYTDDQSRTVQMAALQGRAGGLPPQPKAQIYSALSEFYVDCNETWKGVSCNGDRSDYYDHSMYSMKWRARIVRFNSPLGSIKALLGEFLGQLGVEDGLEQLRALLHELCQPGPAERES